MKSLLIVTEKNYNNHEGEDIDDILIVELNPQADTFEKWNGQIIDKIRKLWLADSGEDKKVVVYIDAATPFGNLLQNLEILMRDNEGIKIELPHVVHVNEVQKNLEKHLKENEKS